MSSGHSPASHKIILLDDSSAVFLGIGGDGQLQSHLLSICLDIDVDIVV